MRASALPSSHRKDGIAKGLRGTAMQSHTIVMPCARRGLTSFVILLHLSISLAGAKPPINERPIIGILTNPNDEPVPEYETTPGYFPASYVKWLEMAGARVVPLPFERPSVVKDLLPFINGVLFTGGDANFTFPNAAGTHRAVDI